MRNLKRALSLGLTAAMISGLMVMGSSAASYADVTSEDNVEAIEVLESVGIMIGDENGNFNPDQNVTRNEMAVVMANLMEYNVATYKDTSPFTDVPSWAEPYVAACWTNGITSGYSDTIYGGSDDVTTAQAALMLMKALGYFQYSSDFGSDWQLATTRQGNAIDLFNGVDSGVTQAMTRNDVAQLVLNTLRAGTVQADAEGSWQIGDVTITNNVKYNYITSNQPYASAIDNRRTTQNDGDLVNGNIVELGEQLYMGDLKLNDNATDVFGRPARYWEYDGNEIGTYAKTELLRQEYTTKVTGKDLYDLLGRSVIADYSFNIYVDGETEQSILGDAYFTEAQMNRSNDSAVGKTGNGVLTQVYQDIDNHKITIAVINTYLAKATEDYDDKNNEVDLDVYAIKDEGRDQYVKTLTSNEDKEDFTIAGEDFDIEDVADGDLFLVTVADGEIQTMEAPEVLAGSTVTSFRVDKYVVSGGTQYDFASAAEYDVETLYNWTGISAEANLKDLTYDIILDQYGYAIGVKLVEDPNQYLFLTGIDENDSNLGARNADANVIFLDGTMDTVTVDLRNSRGVKRDGTIDDNGTLVSSIGSTDLAQANTWCTYTVDNNGVYTLRQVATSSKDAPKAMQEAQNVTTGTVEIDKSHTSLDGVGTSGNAFAKVYGNDETVYINVDNEVDLIEISSHGTKTIIDDVDSVTVGVQNAALEVENLATLQDAAGNNLWTNPPAAEIYTLHDDDGYIIAVVTIGEDVGTTTNYAYITDDVNYEGYDESADVWSWTVPAVVNGQNVELREEGDGLNLLRNLTVGGWYEVRYDADGNVRKITKVDFTKPSDKYVDDVDEIQTNIDNDIEDMLVWLDYSDLEKTGTVGYGSGSETNLSFRGGTLFIDTLNNSQPNGFSVSNSVNVVLALADKNHNPFDDVDNAYTGWDGLEDALEDLDTDATDVSGDGLLDYTLNGHLSFVMEDGVITSIVLNDYTGPRDNTVNAATPVVNVSANPSTVVEGESVTLTATVTNAAACGELTYQWYEKSTAPGAQFTAIAGATSRTYTITDTEGKDGYQYWCKVTNTDESKKVTGSIVASNTTSTGTYTLALTDATMDVKINYMESGTKVFSSDIQPVKAVDGKSYAIIAEEGDYVVHGNKLYRVTETVTEAFKADSYMNVEVPVELAGLLQSVADSKIPAELVVEWDSDDVITYDEKDYIAEGATATAKLADGVGSYNSTGTAYTDTTVTVDADNEAVNNVPASTDYGYFQVTWSGYNVSGPSYVKEGSVSLNVTSGNWTSVNVNDIKVEVSDPSDASVTLTSIQSPTSSSATLVFNFSSISDDCTIDLSYIGA